MFQGLEIAVVDAGLVAGHALEIGANGLPGDAEETVGNVAFVFRAVTLGVVEVMRSTL
jgi:hypothetical protein